MIGNIDTVLIFALLAIIFAILNFLLWMMVWKKSGGSSPGKNKEETDNSLFDEVKEKIDAATERNLRLEDQLWGVLDKLKEQEKIFSQFKDNLIAFKENVAAIKTAENNNSEVLESLEMWSIKTLKTIKECFDEIRNSREHFEKFEKVDILNNNIEDLSSNLTKLRNYLLSKEQ